MRAFYGGGLLLPSGGIQAAGEPDALRFGALIGGDKVGAPSRPHVPR